MGYSTAQYGIRGKLVRSREVTNSDSGETVAVIDIPAYTIIPPQGVFVVVTDAFSGVTPTLDVGDGSDTDGWCVNDAITSTSTGTYADVDAAYNVAGKYYSSADTLDVVVTDCASASGAAYVFAELYDVSDIVDD